MSSMTLKSLSHNISSLMRINPEPHALSIKLISILKEYRGIDWKEYVKHTNSIFANRSAIDDNLSVYTFSNTQMLPLLYNETFAYKVLRGCIRENHYNHDRVISDYSYIAARYHNDCKNNISLENDNDDIHTVIVGISSFNQFVQLI